MLAADEIAIIAGTQGDTLKAVAQPAGRGARPFGGGELILRGSARSDSAAFVEGPGDPDPLPLRRPAQHVRAAVPGVASSSSPATSAPSFGRLTGGIINARVRDPATDLVHGEADFNLYDAGVAVEGPLSDKLVGRRRLPSLLDRHRPPALPLLRVEPVLHERAPLLRLPVPVHLEARRQGQGAVALLRLAGQGRGHPRAAHGTTRPSPATSRAHRLPLPAGDLVADLLAGAPAGELDLRGAADNRHASSGRGSTSGSARSASTPAALVLAGPPRRSRRARASTCSWPATTSASTCRRSRRRASRPTPISTQSRATSPRDRHLWDAGGVRRAPLLALREGSTSCPRCASTGTQRDPALERDPRIFARWRVAPRTVLKGGGRRLPAAPAPDESSTVSGNPGPPPSGASSTRLGVEHSPSTASSSRRPASTRT